MSTYGAPLLAIDPDLLSIALKTSDPDSVVYPNGPTTEHLLPRSGNPSLTGS